MKEILVGRYDASRVYDRILPHEQSPLMKAQREFIASIGKDAKRIGLGRRILDKLKSPKVLVPLAVGAIAVGAFLPGFVEAYAAGATAKAALEYTLGSTLVSPIWENIPNIFSIVKGAVAGKIAPLLGAVQKYMFSLRATLIPALASAGMVGGMLGLVDRAKRMGEAIKLGIAPVERNIPQMFALFGEDTYVGEAFYSVNKRHVIPVVEKPEAMRRVLTGKEEKGTFITVENEEYGSAGLRGPWHRLKFNKKWLVPSKQGSLLMVYGFGETKDEELPLRDESLVDLTIEELSLATQQLREHAQKSNVKPDKVITVYLGNPDRQRKRGTASGLKDVTDRKVAEGTVDVYIDTGKTLMTALKKQLGETGSISFETGVPEYWNGMQKLAKKHNVLMHDAVHPDRGNAAILIYEKNTDESVNSALVMKRRHPNRRIIVLASSLESKERAQNAGVESFCVSEVLAKELYAVQQRLIEGETPESIQQSLL